MVRFDNRLQKKRIVRKSTTTIDVDPGFEKNILALEERIKKSKRIR